MEYQQIWELQDFILDQEHTVERVWDEHDQIAWLVEQGYEPKIQQIYNAPEETVTFSMQCICQR